MKHHEQGAGADICRPVALGRGQQAKDIVTGKPARESGLRVYPGRHDLCGQTLRAQAPGFGKAEEGTGYPRVEVPCPPAELTLGMPCSEHLIDVGDGDGGQESATRSKSVEEGVDDFTGSVDGCL